MKENRGGVREGAGRKKSDIETKIISFRVPAKHAAEIKTIVKVAIAKFIKNKKP